MKHTNNPQGDFPNTENGNWKSRLGFQMTPGPEWAAIESDGSGAGVSLDSGPVTLIAFEPEHGDITASLISGTPEELVPRLLAGYPTPEQAETLVSTASLCWIDSGGQVWPDRKEGITWTGKFPTAERLASLGEIFGTFRKTFTHTVFLYRNTGIWQMICWQPFTTHGWIPVSVILRFPPGCPITLKAGDQTGETARITGYSVHGSATILNCKSQACRFTIGITDDEPAEPWDSPVEPRGGEFK